MSNLINKIGDKLHKGRDDRRVSSENYDYPDDPPTTTTTAGSRQHPIGTSGNGTHGTAITGGSALASHGTSNVPGSFPGDSNHGTTTSSILPDRTLGDTTTTTTTNTNTNTSVLGHKSSINGSNIDRTIPRKPYDPYTSSGQQIAANAADKRNSYGASNNRGPAGDIGSRRDWDDPAVRRTSHGGISNQLHSGPHSALENRDAVPVAGGQKIGTGAAYDSPSHGHHVTYAGTGRDHTTTGYATHDFTHGRDRYDSDSTRETGQKTVGPHNSDLLNKLDPRVDSDPNKAYGTQGQTFGSTIHDYGSNNQHQYGRDAAVAGTLASSHRNDRDRDEDRLGYDQRSSANQPLSQNRDFSDRHNVAGTGLLSRDRDNERHNVTGTTNFSSRDRDNDRYSSTGAPFTSRDRDDDRHGVNNNYTSDRDRDQTTGPHSSSLLNKLDPRVDSSSNNRGYDNQNYSSNNSRSYDNQDYSPNNNRNYDNQTYGSNNNRGYDNQTYGSNNNRGYDNQNYSSRGSLLNNRHAGYDIARQSHGGGTYGIGYEKGYEAGYRDALAHAESQRSGRY